MNLDTLDKSFLRLVTDFSVAKNELMQNSQYVYKDAIVLSPNEKYLQISNSLTSIAFDDSYRVELVSCSDDVMLDITSKVYINEFQDINGIYQIAFEIAPIEQDFYFQKLFLKFTHLDSDLRLWSNSFIVTDNVESFRLDYKNYSYYQGISYDRANFYQSIRIAGFYNLPATKETTKLYTQLNGDIRRSRTTQALEYNYIIEAIDTFGFDRVSVALNSELIYINGTRFKTSENVQSDERQGLSNQFATAFKGQFEAKDTYVDNYQIAAPLVGTYYPLGIYSISGSLPIDATATFNYNLVNVTNVQIYFNGVLLADIIPAIFVNGFTFSLPTLLVGEYYILFEVSNAIGQTIIADETTWNFSVLNGEFDNTEFDNTEFLTN